MAFKRFLVTSALALAAAHTTSQADASAGRASSARLTGVRPEAMGGAFTAVADDRFALYYNPAGLARIKAFSMELLQATFGGSQSIQENISAVQEKMGNLGGSEGDAAGSSLKTASAIIDTIKGRNHWVRLGLNPNIVFPRIGVAVNFNSELNAALQEPAPTLMQISYENDFDIRAGYAHPFLGERLLLGATLAFRHRAAIGDTLGLEYLDTALQGQEALQKKLGEIIRIGQGIGVDTGLLFVADEATETTFGLAIQNLGDLKFAKSSFVTELNAQPPDSLRQSINVGVSITPKWRSFYYRGSLDLKDVNLPGPASRKLGLGAEVGWNNHIRVQMGLSEGYLTAGLETRLWLLNLSYATFVSERATVPGQQAERRHMLGTKILL